MGAFVERIRGTEPEIVIGSFYEDPDGRIARTFGWDGSTRTVSYHYDDGKGGRAVSEADFASWKRRADLRDFPNARDPRLPYVFDLFWDVKHLSELPELLANDEERDAVLEKMREHGIPLPEGMEEMVPQGELDGPRTGLPR